MPEIAKQHFDFIDLPIETKFQKDSDGSLAGRAAVTCIGVFSYRQKDGTVIRQARMAEDVLAPESLATLQSIPVTNEHPEYMIDDSNVNMYRVGETDKNVTHDGSRVSVGLKIGNKEAIRDAENGKRAFSCGYYCDYDYTPGVYLGVAYDVAQKNIRYNHVAMCDVGRAGDTARMLMDSMDADASLNVPMEDNTVPKEYRSVNIDGANYDAEDRVISELARVRDALALATSENKTLKGSLDTQKTEFDKERTTFTAKADDAKAQIDSLTKEVTDLKAKALDEAEIQKRVDAVLKAKQDRADLAEFAKALKVDVADSDTDIALKKKCILAARPGTSLDKADDLYVNARFDCVREDVMARQANAASLRLGASGKQVDSATEDACDLEAAKAKAKETAMGAWAAKQKAKGGKA